MNHETPQSQISFDQTPLVLCFAGLDPSGGAGLQADIETLIALGCQATSIATCVTAQNTQRLSSWQPIPPSMILQQAKLLLEENKIAAVKIGMVGTIETAQAIEMILQDMPNIPVILDPVLSSGQGQDLAQESLASALIKHLLPYSKLVTPNTLEFRKLCPKAKDLDTGVQMLLSSGCETVCITGGHLKTPKLRNKAWSHGRCIYDQTWPRLAGEYHGTGCTFSTAVAAFLAHGMPMETALRQADEYTWKAIAHAVDSGNAQKIPNRLFQQRLQTQHKTGDSLRNKTQEMTLN